MNSSARITMACWFEMLRENRTMRLADFLPYVALTAASMFFVQAVVSRAWTDSVRHAFRAVMAVLFFCSIGMYWLATGEKPDETVYRFVICPFVQFERCRSDREASPVDRPPRTRVSTEPPAPPPTRVGVQPSSTRCVIDCLNTHGSSYIDPRSGYKEPSPAARCIAGCERP